MTPWMMTVAAKDVLEGLREVRQMGLRNFLLLLLVGSTVGLQWVDRQVVVKAVQAHDEKATPAILAVAEHTKQLADIEQAILILQDIAAESCAYLARLMEENPNRCFDAKRGKLRTQ